jgi:hypothetical protein
MEIFGDNESLAFRKGMLEHHKLLALVRSHARKAELTGGERVLLGPKHIRNHVKALEPDE